MEGARGRSDHGAREEKGGGGDGDGGGVPVGRVERRRSVTRPQSRPRQTLATPPSTPSIPTRAQALSADVSLSPVAFPSVSTLRFVGGEPVAEGFPLHDAHRASSNVHPGLVLASERRLVLTHAARTTPLARTPGTRSSLPLLSSRAPFSSTARAHKAADPVTGSSAMPMFGPQNRHVKSTGSPPCFVATPPARWPPVRARRAPRSSRGRESPPPASSDPEGRRTYPPRRFCRRANASPRRRGRGIPAPRPRRPAGKRRAPGRSSSSPSLSTRRTSDPPMSVMVGGDAGKESSSCPSPTGEDDQDAGSGVGSETGLGGYRARAELEEGVCGGEGRVAAQVHLGAARCEPSEVVVHVVRLVAAFLARGDRVGVGGLGRRLALRRGLLRATRGRAGFDERRLA